MRVGTNYSDHSGICKSCKRRYKDRLWNTDEFIRNNKYAGEEVEKARKRHASWLSQDHPEMVQCPLNCIYVVEFVEEVAE